MSNSAVQLARRSTVRALATASLAAIVLVGAHDVPKAAAATIDSTAYTRTTAGATATGSAARSSDAAGAGVYSLGFKLTDTGNDGVPVYVKYRWTILIAGPNGYQWKANPAATWYNRLGYNLAATATTKLTDAQLLSWARTEGPAATTAKLKVEVAVCRDAATDNCSTWWSQTWNTHPDGAFNALFLCNGDTIVIDLQNFFRPAFLPVQNNPVWITVVTRLVESPDATFGSMSEVLEWTHVIQYPSPLAAATVSYVFDATSGTMVDSNGYVSARMVPNRYYAVHSQSFITSSGVTVASTEQPAHSWARYQIQNGSLQGTAGDWKCVARNW